MAYTNKVVIAKNTTRAPVIRNPTTLNSSNTPRTVSTHIVSNAQRKPK